ncbi:hypothetical protein NEHOM01_2087 [Nematocida homosporus]|uniref:uncharacterized protein n=1 Tax=Nematocida homosporus TaxID=1912981 RepID=UPI00221F926F|nr:uncharacterized protein NEHOM01_2087 [Nematocida homosporus]KAI5187314.1 hypothetical protein NEHOM01_2087 [Nematocida homosporus]
MTEKVKISIEQQKKKNSKVLKFQGIGKHIDVLRECNSKIKSIEERIVQDKERIESRIEEFRKQTGQKELFDSKDEAQKAIDLLSKEKSAMTEELKRTSQDLRALMTAVGEEKKRLNMKSATELRNKKEQIKNRIRDKPHSSKEAAEMCSELSRIEKLISMQDMFKEKDEKIMEMEKAKKAQEFALSIKRQELEHQQKKLNEVSAKIGKVKKTAYPEDIKRLQEEVKVLIEEKRVLLEAKRAEHEVMVAKAAEYEVKAAEIEKARAHKAALEEQEKQIESLLLARDELETELASNPSGSLRTLRTVLPGYKLQRTSRGCALALPLSVVSQLGQFNITIPKSAVEIDAVLAEIDTAIVREDGKFEAKKSSLMAQLQDLSGRIAKERQKHGELPRPVFPRAQG